jgi:hypothetical protein
MRKVIAPLIFSEFGLVALIFLVLSPILIWDSLEPKSCHDQVSIASGKVERPSVILRLITVKGHQKQIENYLRDFQSKSGWQYKERYKSELAGRTIFRGSTCKAGRGLVLANHLVSTADLSITALNVFPEGTGSEWKNDTKILYEELNDQWPGQIDFIDLKNEPIEAPDWILKAK